ncbi:MAG TPA: FAD-dependent oxidoreductase [Polyangia bacterium]|nr:FAD-dependent oxidoreductase [Polyangia bacterium]
MARNAGRTVLAIVLGAAAILAPLVYGIRLASRPRGVALATSTDVVVVGSGVAGLSAAYELARGGADVVVVDLASIFGGHAVMATGDMALVDTPFQRARGIADSPDLAYRDITTWGEDADPAWARIYVDRSRDQIYDWVTSLGVSFETFAEPPGNSVLRAHRTKGRGIGLVTPIFDEVARRPNVAFRWNTKVTRLLVENGRVAGVALTSTRTGATSELRARAVVLATGGFQSNLDLVRASWRTDVPFPERFLIGSGWSSTGSGLELAKGAGAALTRLDHQWNYINGLPNPRYPGANRGVSAVNPDSIWVNADGRRFLAERSSPKTGFPILARQKGSTYWSVFDEDAKHSFWVAGSDWSSWSSIERLIFGDPELVKSADTIEALAAKVGLPPAALRETVDHFNQMVDAGVDEDFGRFGPGKTFKPKHLARPPFYAVQFFPMTRKSMGGVAIDTSARALDGAGRAIPGLYAAGELTGLAGINGKYSIEGMFLAPSILTGRVAGRTALAEIAVPPRPALESRALPPSLPAAPTPSPIVTSACLSCHQLPTLVMQQRPGYWHFEKVHTVVLARKLDCARCHEELGAVYDPDRHHVDRMMQARVCPTCHSGEDR